MQALRHTSIGLKVALAPALAIVLMLLLGLMSWFSSRDLSAKLSDVGGPTMARMAAAQDLLRRINDLQLGINQSLAYEGMGQRADIIKAIDDRVVREMTGTRQSLEAFAKSPELTAEQARGMQEVLKHYEAFVKSITDMLELKTVQLAAAGGFAATLADSHQTVHKTLEKVVAVEIQGAKAAALTGADRARRLQWVALVLLAIAVGVASFMTYLMRGSITGALAVAKAQAEALQEGDLRPSDAQAGRDETGRLIGALQATAESLQGLVQQVRDGAEHINVAAAEIANGNQDLSSRTETTAAALEETAASIEELTQTTRHGADNAREANRLALEAAEVAREGGAAVGEVVSTMDAINAQARKIADIIGVIDGIAFQTNILALNAAVEAARAGEQGRGFAVVASEVRSLAQRSAEAAKEIRTLIQSSVERIDSGVDKVQQAGRTMERIVVSIERVSQMVDGVTRAAGEQANGIAQVHEAVADMDRNTQQNAAMVEQAAAAAATLRSQAQQLMDALARFRLN